MLKPRWESSASLSVSCWVFLSPLHRPSLIYLVGSVDYFTSFFVCADSDFLPVSLFCRNFGSATESASRVDSILYWVMCQRGQVIPIGFGNLEFCWEPQPVALVGFCNRTSVNFWFEYCLRVDSGLYGLIAKRKNNPHPTSHSHWVRQQT